MSDLKAFAAEIKSNVNILRENSRKVIDPESNLKPEEKVNLINESKEIVNSSLRNSKALLNSLDDNVEIYDEVKGIIENLKLFYKYFDEINI